MKRRSWSLVIGMGLLVCSTAAQAADPSGYGQAGGEFDIKIPRVPAAELSAAKAEKPPFAPTPEILAEGKAIFLGRGTCFQCHGPEGKGDGGAAKVLPIQPRDFTNPKFNKVRTPGEMMWVLKNGSLGQSGKVPGTGMLPIVGQFLSVEDGWKVLLYERSLGGSR
ncbi:MAG: cytochrome c class I [Nitrospirota bacterium]|nr:cytochrome c class I [Nitrospirota bacterium]MDE3226563.1 cytochrome c class I [Nitrospirota bacterium]MDE3241376.1 cytochrome c class I [Nitrospirota bacterium]